MLAGFTRASGGRGIFGGGASDAWQWDRGASLRRLALCRAQSGPGRLTRRAQDWAWSSVHALLDPDHGNGITDTAPVLDHIESFSALLRSGEDEALSLALRRTESIGRPLGDDAFMSRAAASAGRDLRSRKRGPKDGATN